MSKLCEILGIEVVDGQELTVEDYEKAFEGVKLVEKSALDKALSDNAKLTKDNRALTDSNKEITEKLEASGVASEDEIEKIKNKLAEMTQENLKARALAMFMENGFDKDFAETLIETTQLDDELLGVSGIIATLKTRDDAVAKSVIKKNAVVETPPAPDGVTEKQKMAKEYAKHMKANDVLGMADLKAKNPDLFAEVVSEYVPTQADE